MQIAGWGRTRYFDIGEHQIDDDAVLTKIAKLGPQWKVIHEFKPRKYRVPGSLDKYGPMGFWMGLESLGIYCLTFNSDGCLLYHGDFVVAEKDLLPPIREWTKIEITHEVDEETGKYVISVSSGGIEAMKEETAKKFGEQIDVTIGVGKPDPDPQRDDVFLSGVIRGLIVLEKS